MSDSHNKITIEFSEEEIGELYRYSHFPNMASLFEFNRGRLNKCDLQFTVEELDALWELATKNRFNSKDQKLQKLWDDVVLRVEDAKQNVIYFEAKGLRYDPPAVGGVPHEVTEAMDRLSREKPFASPKEIQAAIDDAINQYNLNAQERFGGISPDRLHRLVSLDWRHPLQPLKLNGSLPREALQGCEIQRIAEGLLRLIQEGGGAPLTVSKNLTRAFVEKASVLMGPEYLKSTRSVSKVINEKDLWPLHKTRILLQMAGLLRPRLKKLHVTPAGRAILKEDGWSELYKDLFYTYFTKVNLAYMDRFWLEEHTLQHSMSYTLFRLSRESRDWVEIKTAAERLVLPMPDVQRIKTHPRFGIDSLIYMRVLHPLQKFGLLEFRREGKYNLSTHFRLTPLFDQFIHFEF